MLLFIFIKKNGKTYHFYFLFFACALASGAAAGRLVPLLVVGLAAIEGGSVPLDRQTIGFLTTAAMLGCVVAAVVAAVVAVIATAVAAGVVAGCETTLFGAVCEESEFRGREEAAAAAAFAAGRS